MQKNVILTLSDEMNGIENNLKVDSITDFQELSWEIQAQFAGNVLLGKEDTFRLNPVNEITEARIARQKKQDLEDFSSFGTEEEFMLLLEKAAYYPNALTDEDKDLLKEYGFDSLIPRKHIPIAKAPKVPELRKERDAIVTEVPGFWNTNGAVGEDGVKLPKLWSLAKEIHTSLDGVWAPTIRFFWWNYPVKVVQDGELVEKKTVWLAAYIQAVQPVNLRFGDRTKKAYVPMQKFIGYQERGLFVLTGDTKGNIPRGAWTQKKGEWVCTLENRFDELSSQFEKELMKRFPALFNNFGYIPLRFVAKPSQVKSVYAYHKVGKGQALYYLGKNAPNSATNMPRVSKKYKDLVICAKDFEISKPTYKCEDGHYLMSTINCISYKKFETACFKSGIARVRESLAAYNAIGFVGDRNAYLRYAELLGMAYVEPQVLFNQTVEQIWDITDDTKVPEFFTLNCSSKFHLEMARQAFKEGKLSEVFEPEEKLKTAIKEDKPIKVDLSEQFSSGKVVRKEKLTRTSFLITEYEDGRFHVIRDAVEVDTPRGRVLKGMDEIFLDRESLDAYLDGYPRKDIKISKVILKCN